MKYMLVNIYVKKNYFIMYKILLVNATYRVEGD